MASRWTCPACDRQFGRRNQSHQCDPVVSYDQWFVDRPAHWQPIADRVIDHLESLGDIVVDAAAVGLLVKRRFTFVEMRPVRSDLRLSMIHPHPIDDPRIVRRVQLSANRTAHFVDLNHEGAVDQQLLDWLTESFLVAAS
ncbi:MAG: DUF5655 domain-containing protein [Acidimicrobiia bacterium]|nr:DUF5655 domain-containing protein [Acidimicrobiia bacterium]